MRSLCAILIRQWTSESLVALQGCLDSWSSLHFLFSSFDFSKHVNVGVIIRSCGVEDGPRVTKELKAITKKEKWVWHDYE